jgi:lysophospholipase L1-like esterase
MLDIPIINAGIDGDTSIEALKRLKPDVLDRQPRLVIIEFCGNDFLRKIPFEVTMSNIKEMVERCQAKGAMVAIADISAGLFLREYRQAFRKLTKEKDAIFIPGTLSGIITNPSMKSDFMHPNANGYQMIAERIYRAILPSLTKLKK